MDVEEAGTSVSRQEQNRQWEEALMGTIARRSSERQVQVGSDGFVPPPEEIEVVGASPHASMSPVGHEKERPLSSQQRAHDLPSRPTSSASYLTPPFTFKRHNPMVDLDEAGVFKRPGSSAYSSTVGDFDQTRASALTADSTSQLGEAPLGPDPDPTDESGREWEEKEGAEGQVGEMEVDDPEMIAKFEELEAEVAIMQEMHRSMLLSGSSPSSADLPNHNSSLSHPSTPLPPQGSFRAREGRLPQPQLPNNRPNIATVAVEQGRIHIPGEFGAPPEPDDDVVVLRPPSPNSQQPVITPILPAPPRPSSAPPPARMDQGTETQREVANTGVQATGPRHTPSIFGQHLDDKSLRPAKDPPLRLDLTFGQDLPNVSDYEAAYWRECAKEVAFRRKRCVTRKEIEFRLLEYEKVRAAKMEEAKDAVLEKKLTKLEEMKTRRQVRRQHQCLRHLQGQIDRKASERQDHQAKAKEHRRRLWDEEVYAMRAILTLNRLREADRAATNGDQSRRDILPNLTAWADPVVEKELGEDRAWRAWRRRFLQSHTFTTLAPKVAVDKRSPMAIKIQTVCRGWMARRDYQNTRKLRAILRIQPLFRGHLSRKRNSRPKPDYLALPRPTPQSPAHFPSSPGSSLSALSPLNGGESTPGSPIAPLASPAPSPAPDPSPSPSPGPSRKAKRWEGRRRFKPTNSLGTPGTLEPNSKVDLIRPIRLLQRLGRGLMAREQLARDLAEVGLLDSQLPQPSPAASGWPPGGEQSAISTQATTQKVRTTKLTAESPAKTPRSDGGSSNWGELSAISMGSSFHAPSILTDEEARRWMSLGREAALTVGRVKGVGMAPRGTTQRTGKGTALGGVEDASGVARRCVMAEEASAWDRLLSKEWVRRSKCAGLESPSLSSSFQRASSLGSLTGRPGEARQKPRESTPPLRSGSGSMGRPLAPLFPSGLATESR